MQKNSLRIDVLGTSFTIAAEEDRLYLDSMLKRYKLKVAEIQKNTGIDDPLKTAILTGFTLCDEIERVRSGDVTGKSKYEYMRIGERLAGLSERIDSFINERPAAGQPKEKSAKAPRLKNEFKHYDWGSTDWIPELLGLSNPDSRPWAEMWMGTHEAAPSMVELPGGNAPLKSVAGDLPFLFKLIAAGKPLSVQAHPNPEQAAQGFARENAAGIPLADPKRCYKDPNHKPEILAALSPFTLMAGFRERSKIIELLDAFACPALIPLRRELRSEAPEEEAYRSFLRALFNMPQAQKDEVSSYIARQIDEVKSRAAAFRGVWELVEEFQAFFPGDISVIAPLYLNVLELAPGEALYIPAGILHSYIRGLGVELMSPSDNVLRGGLTEKFVNTAELLNILVPRCFTPSVLKPVPRNYVESSFYTPAAEWSLSVMTSGGGRKEHFSVPQDSIVLVVSGQISVVFFDGRGGISLSRGESAFFSAAIDRGSFAFEGAFTAYIASRGGVN